MYVYKVTNLINGKFYIGKCERDVWLSTDYFGSGLLIKQAINKYGIHNFIKEVLYETNDKNDLDIAEMVYIELFDACNKSIAYNIAKGDNGGDTLSNNPNRECIIKRYTEWSKEFWSLEKNREMRSKQYCGSGNPFFKKMHTAETKLEISKRKSGVPVNDNIKKKISDTLKYKYATGELTMTISDECRKKYQIHIWE